MACVNNRNLYDTQIVKRKCLQNWQVGIHLHPKSPNPHGFMSKVYKFYVMWVMWRLCLRTVFLALRGKLRSYEACMATTMTKGMTVCSSKSSRAIETLHFVLQSMHRSKDPHPKDPCLSHQRKAVKFLNLKMQKIRKHMNNMNPGPQHTDAHGRGKK